MKTILIITKRKKSQRSRYQVRQYVEVAMNVTLNFNQFLQNTMLEEHIQPQYDAGEDDGE